MPPPSLLYERRRRLAIRWLAAFRQLRHADAVAIIERRRWPLPLSMP